MNYLKKILKNALKSFIRLYIETKQELEGIVIKTKDNDPEEDYELYGVIDDEDKDESVETISRVVEWVDSTIEKYAKSENEEDHLNGLALMEEFGPWVDDDVEDIEFTSIPRIKDQVDS